MYDEQGGQAASWNPIIWFKAVKVNAWFVAAQPANVVSCPTPTETNQSLTILSLSVSHHRFGGGGAASASTLRKGEERMPGLPQVNGACEVHASEYLTASSENPQVRRHQL